MMLILKGFGFGQMAKKLIILIGILPMITIQSPMAVRQKIGQKFTLLRENGLMVTGMMLAQIYKDLF